MPHSSFTSSSVSLCPKLLSIHAFDMSAVVSHLAQQICIIGSSLTGQLYGTVFEAFARYFSFRIPDRAVYQLLL